MSTTPVPTKPNAPTPEPDTRARREPTPPPVLGPSSADRTVDADVLVDIPQLSVEELTLELQASALLDNVKLEAKGLELGLYVRANLDRLVTLVQENDNGGDHAHPVRDRAVHAAAHGAKAAGLTAAGLAGGALLESRTKAARKLPLPGAPKGMRALGDAIVKRLP